MGHHKDAGLGYRHAISNFEYADATERTNATGFITEDIGKYADQLDNDSVWKLTSIAPTWLEITSTVDSPWFTSGSNIYFNTGNIGMGTDVPALKLHVDTNEANTTAIQRWENTSGYFDMFHIGATPELDITSGPGGLANDTTNGHMYIKKSGTGTAGWQKLATSEELGNTGIVIGCKVSINVGDDTLIDIEAGEYDLEGVHYNYGGITGQDPGFSTSPAEDTVFVYLYSSGLVFRNTSGDLGEWTDNDFTTQATLARLTSFSDTNHSIQRVRDDRFITGGHLISQRIYQRDAFGAGVYALNSGGWIEENGTTAYQMDQTSGGILFDAERVKHTFSEDTNISGLRVISSGPTLSFQNPFVAPESYDDGAGGLTGLISNRWAIHTILKVPKGPDDDGTEGAFFMVISSDQYTSRLLAEATPIEFGPFSSSQVVPVARILVEGGGTGIVDIVDTRPFAVSYGVPS
jgi:hypothetical protein